MFISRVIRQILNVTNKKEQSEYNILSSKSWMFQRTIGINIGSLKLHIGTPMSHWGQHWEFKIAHWDQHWEFKIGYVAALRLRPRGQGNLTLLFGKNMGV